MRYRLRTLVVLLAICPPLMAWGWAKGQEYCRWLEQQAEFRRQKTARGLVQLGIASTVGVGAHSDTGLVIDWQVEPGPVADLDLPYTQGPGPDESGENR